MYSATAESEAKVVYKEPLFVDEDCFNYCFHSRSTDRNIVTAI